MFKKLLIITRLFSLLKSIISLIYVFLSILFRYLYLVSDKLLIGTMETILLPSLANFNTSYFESRSLSFVEQFISENS